MAMTLTGFVFDSSGNAVSGATVQGYVSADNATTTAESATTTDSNGKWSITTSTAARIPMDVKITFGDSVRWLKAGDSINVSKLTLTDTLTVGEDDVGFDVTFHGASAGAALIYDASADTLEVRGPSADATTSTGKLLLTTALTNVNASDVIGDITFKAPLESGGADAITAAASITAVAQGTFASDLNATDLIFSTGSSAAASEKFRFTSDGELGVGGTNYGSSGDVLTSGGAGAAPTWETPTTGDITGVTAGAGLSGTATSGTASLALDLSSGLSDVTPANGDKLATLDSDGSTEQLTTLASLATLFAGTGLTASSSVIGVDDGTASAKGAVIVAGGTGATVSYSSGTATVAVDASQAITALTGGDLTIYEDANNADVSLKMGTSATESLTIQVLNGSSNKTAEEVHFSTATASGTANHGAMVFDVDGTDILTINDGGLSLTGVITASGIVKTDDATDATSTTDGSLQTDGGLSVVKDGIFGNDVTLITDSAVLNLGVGSDVSITHDGTTGGTITGTPMVYESKGAAALANDTHAGIVLEFLAAETIAVGQLVYMSTTDGRVGLADANASGKFPAIGVAVSAQGSAGSAVKILTHGTFNDSDGFGGNLNEGNVLYLSETAGAFDATAPSDDGDRVQVVGIAIGPRDVFISPSLDVIEHD